MKRMFASCLAALFVVSAPAFASEPDDELALHDIVNTFTPDMAYDCCNGWAVYGPGSGMTQMIAMPFTPDKNYTLKDITVAATNFSGTNGVTVTVNKDSGGVPGAEIEKRRFTDLPAINTCCVVQTMPGKGVAVKAGTQYWVVLKTDKKSLDSGDSWNWNAIGATGTFVFSKQGAPWREFTDVLPAMRVRGK